MQDRDTAPLPDEDGESGRPNKSALKREAQALVDLGVRLAALPPDQWEALQLDETLVDALTLYNRISAHGAKARQRGLIGKLLRQRDTTSIWAYLHQLELDKTLQTRDFHRIETWRDRLLHEGAEAMQALAVECPQIPQELLARLVAEASRTTDMPKRNKLSRELFRLLREHL